MPHPLRSVVLSSTPTSACIPRLLFLSPSLFFRSLASCPPARPALLSQCGLATMKAYTYHLLVCTLHLLLLGATVADADYTLAWTGHFWYRPDAHRLPHRRRARLVGRPQAVAAAAPAPRARRLRRRRRHRRPL